MSENTERVYHATAIGRILWSAIVAVVLVVASGAIWGSSRASTAYVNEQTLTVARANMATVKEQDRSIEALDSRVNRVEATAAAKSEEDRKRDAMLERMDAKLTALMLHMMVPPVQPAQAPR